MFSTNQLVLFGQRPQPIRYGTNAQGKDPVLEKVPTGDARNGAVVKPVSGPGWGTLVNESGEVLFAGRGSQRLLLERSLVSGCTLRGLHAPGANLKCIQLRGSVRFDLAESDWSEACLTGSRVWADLSGSKLSGLTATDSDFHGSRLADCDLSGARLNGSDFGSVSFRRSNLSRSQLQRVRLIMSDLRDCRLTNACLTGSDVSGCDLRGADLTGADIRGVYWRGTTLTATALGTAKMAPIRQRIRHLVQTYPALVHPWLMALEKGRWQANQFNSLSGFLSYQLGYRLGAGWQGIPGSTEWILWQFLRSIQPGRYPATDALAYWLHQWLLVSKGGC